MEGWIKLYRKITEWEWYSDNATRSVFLHLLVIASNKTKQWKNETVNPGGIIAGRKQLSTELGLTEQQIRRALKNLQNTGEITIKTTSRHSLIQLKNYNLYQQNNQQRTSNSTNKEPHRKKKEEIITPIVPFCQSPEDDTFLSFWQMYPNKKNKQSSIKAWAKLTEEEKQLALSALPQHLKQDQWIRDDGKYIPHPATWINQKRFQDELTPAVDRKSHGKSPSEILYAERLNQIMLQNVHANPTI